MQTNGNRGGGVVSFAYKFLIEHLIHKLPTIVTRFPVLLKKCDLKKLHLVLAWDYKSITFDSNNQFNVSQSSYSSQWLHPNTGYLLFVYLETFFAMIKTRCVFITQSTTLTMYLGYPVNYFLKKASSKMFEWVLNTPLKTFRFITVLINNSSRSYLCISNIM